MSTLTYFFRVFPYDTPKTVKNGELGGSGLQKYGFWEILLTGSEYYWSVLWIHFLRPSIRPSVADVVSFSQEWLITFF